MQRFSALTLAASLAAAALLPLPALAEGEDPPTVEVESSNPVSGDPAAIDEGAQLYGRWCVQCHGFNADGVSPRWGKMAFDLRQYFKGYEEFVHVVATGRVKRRMPPFGEYLDLDQINQIGAFLETLAIDGANWK